jgi:aminoglycoside N3'-acetyltransferase
MSLGSRKLWVSQNLPFSYILIKHHFSIIIFDQKKKTIFKNPWKVVPKSIFGSILKLDAKGIQLVLENHKYCDLKLASTILLKLVLVNSEVIKSAD